MSQENLGFTGAVPPNVSIQANVARALEFQGTHTPTETEHWLGGYEINQKMKSAEPQAAQLTPRQA